MKPCKKKEPTLCIQHPLDLASEILKLNQDREPWSTRCSG
jgi:hypothetical protein